MKKNDCGPLLPIAGQRFFFFFNSPLLTDGKRIWRLTPNMKTYKLLASDGTHYESNSPGTFGGHRKLKIYGRLNCPSALNFIHKGQYVKYRVFFADEATAIEAGYRPCAKCMKDKYQVWKSKQNVDESI